MTNKYQRPAGAFAGGAGLANRTKYQDDATATPKRTISSAKVDGDLNYVIDAINQIDEASGLRASIHERLNVSLNADGTLKYSVAGALDEWIVHLNAGTISRVDNYTITIGGDWRQIYSVNRRIRLTVLGQELMGDVASVSFAAGVTTVGVVDMLDSNGFVGLIGAAPTQVSYGPLSGGTRGNTPRRFDSLRIPAGLVTYEMKGAGTDLMFTRNGVPAAMLTDGGLAGYAPGSVLKESLAEDVMRSLVPSGVINAFAGATAPEGWLMCAGQAVSRSAYVDLYLAIGTAYGTGDGSTTFNLPDLRGRVPFGLDNMGGTDAGRLSAANTLGGSGGAQTKSGTTASYTLTIADIPAHTHDVNGVYGAASNNPSGSSVNYDNTTAGNRVVSKSVGGGGGHSHAITNFDIMPPYLLLNHIIKT